MVGESSAGADPPALARGTACRIFTGARVPAGADTVVMQEKVQREGDRLRIDARPSRGQNVRREGEDIAPGTRRSWRESRLAPGALALAAMLDAPELVVRRRPRVTILCTGNELRAPGAPRRARVDPRRRTAPRSRRSRARPARTVRVEATARDDAGEVADAVARALEGTEVLLTIGGVSVGDHDVVRPALERVGVVLDFWKVAIKPGKPLVVGRAPGARVLGLPGNPASALVTFALFGAPLLRALQGDARPHAMRLPVRLAAARRRSPD